MTETIALAAGSDPSFLPRFDRKLARMIMRRPATLHSERTIVTFSFDDISRNAATVGAKILEDEGVLGTFFVAGGLLGKRFGPWQFAEMPEIVALHAAGHEIGGHTLSHPDCQLLSSAGLHEETARNAAVLEAAMLDLRVASFAYPYGSVGCLQKRVMMHEFACSRGTHPDINSQHLDIGQLNSFTLNDEGTPVERISELIEETKAANGWLMFQHICQPLAVIDPALSDQQLSIRARTIFAAVHGIVALSIEGKFVGLERDVVSAELEAVVGALVRGFRATTA